MKRHHVLASISFRLFVFNLLILVFPIASFLFLNTYEEQLLKYLEHALVQQGRIIAAALAGPDELKSEEARELLRSMEKKHDARFRILDNSGRILADSSTLFPAEEELQSRSTVTAYDGRNWSARAEGETLEGEEANEEAPTRERFLYRLASLPVRIMRNYLLPPPPPIESGDFYQGVDRLLGSEVQTALEGRYGAATRISTGGQISVTLYSALPVLGEYQVKGKGVIGVVLVSQSSYRILQDLYNLRLDIFKIFLLSLLATILISIFLSLTISQPLKNLSRKAEEIFTPGGKFRGRFLTRGGKDEIGKLATSLDKLTERLREHIAFIESFAADVSHELKNPIASIRSAAEVADGLIISEQSDRQTDPVTIKRFLSVIQGETARMESLISSIREISKIDARLDEEARERIDLVPLIRQTVERFQLQAESKNITFRLHFPESAATISPNAFYVHATPERIIQVLENLVANAVSFSPEGGRVSIDVSTHKRQAVPHGKGEVTVHLVVSDEGPGVPEEILDNIFLRFFTYRRKDHADAGKDNFYDRDEFHTQHTGLGLAIVKAIVKGYGGSITAGNNPSGGARFTVILPKNSNYLT